MTEENTMTTNPHYSRPRSKLDNQLIDFDGETIRFVRADDPRQHDPQERKIDSALDWFMRGVYAGGFAMLVIFVLILASGVLT